MTGLRLRLALDAGLTLPETGEIVVYHPAEGADLSALPRDRTTIVQPLKPANDAFAAQGFATLPEPPETAAALSLICLPRAKAEARALVAAAAARTSGPLVIDGQKTDGVDSMLKAVRARTALKGTISKAHGKLFWFEGGDFEDWAQGPALTPGGFWTAPGVFSSDAIDPASALLAEALPEKLGAVVADLGAGWGFLSAYVLTRETVRTCHLVEAHHMALECARRNVTDPRAQFHWADATRWTAPEPLDSVVMNPPFHISRAGVPSLGQAFIAAAARLLKPSGSLFMVANRHLPYEAALASHFAKTIDLGGEQRFKLFRADKPRRAQR